MDKGSRETYLDFLDCLHLQDQRQNRLFYGPVCYMAGIKQCKNALFLLESYLVKGSEAISQLLKLSVVKKANAFIECLATVASEKGFGDNFHFIGKLKICSGFYNIDASTDDYHCESDGGYTTILLLKQNWEGMGKNLIIFEFKLGSELVTIPLVPSSLLWFHGMFLTHCQQHNDKEKPKKIVFLLFQYFGLFQLESCGTWKEVN